MKKFVSVIFAGLIFVFGLTGCSNGVSQEEYDKVVAEKNALLQQIEEMGGTVSVSSENDSMEPNSRKTSGEFDKETVLNELQVSQFKYSSKFANYAFLTIKNNSEYNLNITANVTFYNESGALIGAKSANEEAVESGYDTILYFMPDEEFFRMEYELDVSEEKHYDCVISELSFEETEAKNKIILSVTNNGKEAARFVEASVLFFNGNSVVGFSQNYAVDDDSELKPGKTIIKEMDCYEAFDSYQIFLSGRR